VKRIFNLLLCNRHCCRALTILSSVAGPGCFPSRVKKILDPDPSKELKYFEPKKLSLSSRKYDPGSSSRTLDPDFFPSLIQGSKKSTGSRIRIRNTDFKITSLISRVESMDLETAEVKRQRMAPPTTTAAEPRASSVAAPGPRSNLDRNKSKSVMSVTAKTGTVARGNVLHRQPEMFYRVRIGL
jgi:hypothetical protein